MGAIRNETPGNFRDPDRPVDRARIERAEVFHQPAEEFLEVIGRRC